MTRQDIIRMAQEADLWVAGQEPYQTQIERFAALVASAEREACALVCEERNMGDNNREDMEAMRCAADIRARGDR